MRDGIVWVDREKGTIIRCNQAFCNMTGKSRHKVVEELLSKFFPADCPKEQRVFLEKHREENSLLIENGEVINSRNEIKPVRISTSEFKSLDKPIVQVVFVDNSKQVQDMIALQSSEERLRLAQSIVHLGFWDWALDSGDLYWSDEVFQIYGCTWDTFEPSFDGILTFVHPEDRRIVRESVEQSIENKTELDITFRIQTEDGKTKWLHSKGRTHYEGDAAVRMFGTVMDITHDKEFEHDLINTREEAKASNAAIKKLIAGLSHEMRTPLSGILGILELLEYEKLTTEQSEHLYLLQRSADSLQRVTEDLLDISRIETGNLEILNRIFQPRVILKEVKRFFAVFAHENNSEILLRFDRDIPEALTGDSGRLRQILISLAGNLLELADNCTLEIHASGHSLQESEDGYQLCLNISCQGVFAPESRDRMNLFRNMHWASLNLAHKYQGVGLALTQQLVGLMHGKCAVNRSENDNELQIYLTLPFKLAESPEEGKKKTASDIFSEKPPSILLVEDEIISQRVCTAMMKKLGCSVDLAPDGEIAVQMAGKKPYDLIFMDIHMPIMDGFEATRRIRKLPPPVCDAPIIAFTIDALSTDREECLRIGMNDHLSKPALIEDFAVIIRKWLKR